MSNQKKIEKEVKKIGILKERIVRLITLREKKIADIKKEHDSKINTVYTFIDLANTKIWDLRRKQLKDKEIPPELGDNLGIEWIEDSAPTLELKKVEYMDNPFLGEDLE